MKEQMILLGTNKLDDKSTKKINDSKGFVSTSVLGYGENFYGGRVKNVAKTNIDGIYLLIGKEGVIDIAVKDVELLTKAQLVYLIKRIDPETKLDSDKIKKDAIVAQYKKLRNLK